MTKNLTNALDEDPVMRRSRLKGKHLRIAQRIRRVPQAVPSPREKAKGLELLLSAVRLKRQSRQAQEGLREVA